ncbi:MAG: hypothetical protein Q9227_004230 [Pyrenula ochraceoflavens]
MALSTLSEDERFAIHLQLEEFESMSISDEPGRAAQLNAYQSDLQTLGQNLASQRMQRSLAAAMITDHGAISEECSREQQAIDDRYTAARLVGRQDIGIPEAATEQLQYGSIVDPRLSILNNSTMTNADEDMDDSRTVVDSEADGAVSAVGAQNALYRPVCDVETGSGGMQLRLQSFHNEETGPLIDCDICADAFHESQIATIDCEQKHNWCANCVVNRFELAAKSEGSWPPKCCKAKMTPTGKLREFLSPDLQARFTAKSIEWGTKDRTYCFERTCSEFIVPSTIRGRYAQCTKCRQATCANCKAQYHDSQECSEFPTEAENPLNEWVEEQGCAKCPDCRRLVEIKHGCNHMT